VKVVLATGNPGKIRECQEILAPLGLETFPQSDFDVGEVEETGKTFVENALIKARHVCEITNLPALADDSGLVVKALNGAPGIYSARYAGQNASALENIKALLKALENTDAISRHAMYYCCMVFLRHSEDPTPLIAHAIWKGRILPSPEGENGFGYDPVFYVKEKSCSAAMLTPEVKNKFSHRGKALRALVQEYREREAA
jgi:XTP/dITP diphosphohydrolase